MILDRTKVAMNELFGAKMILARLLAISILLIGSINMALGSGTTLESNILWEFDTGG